MSQQKPSYPASNPPALSTGRPDRALFPYPSSLAERQSERAFGKTRMLNWLRRKPVVVEEPWIRAQQPPGVPFPFPKGAKLKPEEDVVLALPRALIADDEKIGSVLLCDDNAEFTLNEKAGAFLVRLKAGMVFALAKSCEIMLIAEDKRPRSLQIMKPVKGNAQPGASPNGGPATRSGDSGASAGPPSVS